MRLFWSLEIIFFAILALVVTHVLPDLPIRWAIVFWFFCTVPGTPFIRFLDLKDHVAAWTLTIALSFSIDGLVAGIQLYAGLWSPLATVDLLCLFSIGGALSLALSTVRLKSKKVIGEYA